MRAERVGIFGGTFDPPHVAHLAVAEAARENAALDRVVWVPAHASPFKGDVPSSEPRHRLEMVRRATASHPAFSVSSEEVERGGISYTVDTLRALQAEYSGAELFLVVGGDALAGFDGWKEAKEILRMATLLTYARPDQAATPGIEAWLRDRLRVIEAPPIGLSATDIRRHIANGGSARYLVPDSVVAYIAEHRLYRPISPSTAPILSAS